MMVTDTKYSLLHDFIEQKGKCVNENFPETALTKVDVLSFLELLRINRVRPLGIELWRLSEHGYSVDGLNGWYAEKKEVDADCQAAVFYMNSASIKSDDLFVIQY